MSRVVSIFLDYPETINQLVSRIENTLSVRFKDYVVSQEKSFGARTADSVITVSKHNFDNDRDLNFEDYVYEIEFRPIRDSFYQIHERQTWATAQAVFSTLKAVLNCSMMLVDDLQKKLAEYCPVFINSER